ncbi:MAG: helix-turn-helix transcriptional regulator [Amphritea sp.]
MRLYEGLNNRDVADWHKDLALLTESLRLNTFPEILCETLGKIVNFQHSIFMTYKKGHAPIFLYDNYTPEQRELTLNTYMKGIYVLDPFYTAITQNKPAGIYRLIELAPDSFEQSDYYQDYYKNLKLEDEIGVFLDLTDDVTLIVSLGRSSGLSSLTRGERNILSTVFPVIRSLTREFWRLQAGQYIEELNKANQVDCAISSFGDGLLTERELEIIGLMLRGHSSKSIASELGITPGTVKVHRKNIYTRLKISTQSQLFSQFLNHLMINSEN